ncbi:AraC family transcriptional regulator [Sphingobacterium sp.]|uniref:helix-turn-helix domain-containing protein n=1 Tax=Sphingobacterium sp. TaxID=341027 RepID=UPI0028A1103A|nr:AraC family transcriptional regulator [Sphingobacterium sp.]
MHSSINKAFKIDHFYDYEPQEEAFPEKLSSDFFYNLIQGPIKVEVPKKAEYFSIVLFQQGTGKIQIDNFVHTICERKAFVVFPGQYGSCNILDGTIAHHLMVKTEIYESISSITNISVGKLEPISAFEITEHLFNVLLFDFLQIKEFLESEIKGSEDIILSRFKTIYLILKSKCMQVRDIGFVEASHPVVVRFIQLAEENFKRNRNIAFYANKLSIQPGYLSTLCKTQLGLSAKQIISNRLISEAKNLLITSGHNIKQIVYDLGFNEASHFTVFFKKETGFLPKDFVKLRKRGIAD